MVKKIQRGLGRGLGALLGEDVVAEAAQEAQAEPLQPAEPVDAVRMLPIGQIDPNREQPRRSFDEAALKELAASIEAVGASVAIGRLGWPGSTRFLPSCGIGTAKSGWRRH